MRLSEARSLGGRRLGVGWLQEGGASPASRGPDSESAGSGLGLPSQPARSMGGPSRASESGGRDRQDDKPFKVRVVSPPPPRQVTPPPPPSARAWGPVCGGGRRSAKGAMTRDVRPVLQGYGPSRRCDWTRWSLSSCRLARSSLVRDERYTTREAVELTSWIEPQQLPRVSA